VDEQKKQKLMIGVLAVLIVGAGTSYFVFRDRGPGELQPAVRSASERRVRETTTAAERPKRTQRPTTDTAPQTAERREREPRDTRASSGGTRRRTDVKEEKKKKLAPAS
jgi:hypothetical protein